MVSGAQRIRKSREAARSFDACHHKRLVGVVIGLAAARAAKLPESYVRTPMLFAVLAAIIWISSMQHPAIAQMPPESGGPVDPAVIDDLVVASRILFSEGVLDGLGHVSIRHPTTPIGF